MQKDTPVAKAFTDFTTRMVEELVKRNEELPPTEIVRITTMAGCAPQKEQKA
jgi:ATP-binding protein involved in chromosome partitioning